MSTDPSSAPRGLRLARYRSRTVTAVREWFVKAALIGSGVFSITITFTILVVLLQETTLFFGRAAHEWKTQAPEKIEFAEAAIARAEAGISEQRALLASGSAAEQAAASREIAELQRQLEYERQNLSQWQWKRDHATPLGIARGFFGTGKWSPQYSYDYGIWPLITGTVCVSLIAMIVALPLGLVTAIYLSEYAPRKLRAFLKPTLEILAGIPTVVYGYFALRIITPGLIMMHNGFGGFNALSAGLMVGILCLPIVTSLAEDALQAVPRSLRDAAYGLGSTRFDVSIKVVLPAALSGIVSAFLLAIARAIGETMIVALAAGSTPTLTLDPRKETQTMTGYMVQIIGGDAPHGTPEYSSLYAVAAMLFVMTLSLTVLGNVVRRRFREAYQ
jgi:phosphate transport system permease protein